MKRVLFCVLALTLALAVQVNAAVVTVPNPPVSIIGVTGYATSGDEMDGMLVTAYFRSGATQTVPWADTGPGAGAAIGTLWRLDLSGDTFSANWNLVNNTGRIMDSLRIDPFPGKTVFDIILGSTVTPFSAQGRAEFNGTLTGTYTSAVGIGLNAPLGDLYKLLDVTFGPDGLPGRTDLVAAVNGPAVNTATWRADTDNIGLPPTPIPGSLLLLGSGLLGLVGWRIRRN